MSYRRVDAGEKYAACIGMNAAPKDMGYYVGVGDSIAVVETTTSHDRRGTDLNPDFWASYVPSLIIRPFSLISYSTPTTGRVNPGPVRDWPKVFATVGVIGTMGAIAFTLLRNH